MSIVARTLLKTLGWTLTKQMVIGLLENAAKRTDNTVDDSLVSIVKVALETQPNPFEGLRR